eukprot:1765003-Amphidinium_carterae.1
MAKTHSLAMTKAIQKGVSKSVHIGPTLEHKWSAVTLIRMVAQQKALVESFIACKLDFVHIVASVTTPSLVACKGRLLTEVDKRQPLYLVASLTPSWAPPIQEALLHTACQDTVVEPAS